MKVTFILCGLLAFGGCSRLMCRAGVAPCAPFDAGEEPRGDEYGAVPWGGGGPSPIPEPDRTENEKGI